MRYSAPPGSFKSHKYLKPNQSDHQVTRPKPYRAPSDSTDDKLIEIKRSLNRYSGGSSENILNGELRGPPLSPQRKQEAVNTISRVINRQISKENRSGSQPNLSNIPDSPTSPRIQPSPSMSNLSFNISKMEVSRGATVSVPPLKVSPSNHLHTNHSASSNHVQMTHGAEIPVGIRGSPDGASIRSESPLPPNEQNEMHDNLGEINKYKTPRIMGQHAHSGLKQSFGVNQLPHKIVPAQNVVLRSRTSKPASSKARYSLPPPPPYNMHMQSSANPNSNRKEIALSGHDWSRQDNHRNSDYDQDTISRPTSGYDSDMWTYEREGPPSSGPSSDCHSECSYGINSFGSINQLDQGSIIHMDEDSHYNYDRRPNQEYSPHYRISPATSPAVSPNQSVDKAMRESRDQDGRNTQKNSSKGLFGGFFSRRDKHEKGSVSSSTANSTGSHLQQVPDYYSKTSRSPHFNDNRNFKTIREYSPRAFKFYMEQRVDNLLKAASERIKRKEMLEVEMRQYKMTESERVNMRNLLRKKETNHLRLIRAKLSLEQFRMVNTLGKGAFGEVSLVQKKDTQMYYALKTLNKKEVLLRNQIAHVKAERDILKEADNEWIVKLYYSFQDGECLYFVMEYIPGGDLMSLLIKKGTFPENLARFYTAELVYAVSSVHDMGFIHRDIKPDNVLICRDGHIKLTDFGLCTGFRWTHDSNFYKDSYPQNQNGPKISGKINRKNHSRKNEAFSLVGTPNYIAPEVLQACAETGGGYTKSCDWWSVGVILFEMVIGYAPFHAQTPQQTQEKILAWRHTFQIPPDRPCSRAAANLMKAWITGEETRLSGLDFIKRHPYFSQIEWNQMRYMHPPYVPKIQNAEDISNFDPVDEYSVDDTSHCDPAITHTLQNHAFLEFTFRRFFDQDGHPQNTARNQSQGHAGSRGRGVGHQRIRRGGR